MRSIPCIFVCFGVVFGMCTYWCKTQAIYCGIISCVIGKGGFFAAESTTVESSWSLRATLAPSILGDAIKYIWKEELRREEVVCCCARRVHTIAIDIDIFAPCCTCMQADESTDVWFCLLVLGTWVRASRRRLFGKCGTRWMVNCRR